MRQVTKAVTLFGAMLRVTGVTVAALAMLAAQPQAVLAAHSVMTVGDAGSAAIVGSGPGSSEIPAQLPGSADRPILSRDGGSGRNSADNGSKNKSNTGTRSASKKTTAGTNHQTGTVTGEHAPATPAAAQNAASVSGTQSQSKAATTAGTDHQTGTNTVGESASVVTPANVTPASSNANVSASANVNAESSTPANNSAVAGFQQPPMSAAAAAQTSANVAGQQNAAQAGANVAGQQNAAQVPMAGVLGLQGLPSTSTAGAALPAGTIALLSMGGALYAIRRKLRK